MYTLGKKSFRNGLLVGIVGLGITLSIIVSAMSYYAHEKIIHAQFSEEVENRHSAIKREIDNNLAALTYLQALYYSSGYKNRNEFSLFANHILKQYGSIQALEWIPRVPDSRRELYERAARRDGFDGFTFTDRIAPGKLKTAEQRKEYYPVYFVEPNKGNEMALGFDLSSNPTRREALEAAKRTGEMSATARISLVQDTNKHVGFIVFAPVYRIGTASDSKSERRDALEGFAAGAFKIDDIIEKATKYVTPEGIDYFIYDMSAPEYEQFLYEHAARTRTTPLLINGQPETSLKVTKTLDVAGRKWIITYAATPDFIASRSNLSPWGLLLAGLMFTGLVAGAIVSGVRHAERVERYARDISEANANLAGEMMERKKVQAELTLFRNLIDRTTDSIFVVDPETGLLLDVNDAACNALGYGREELLKMTVLDIDASVIQDLSSWKSHVEELKDKGHMVLEARQKRKNGTTFPVDININHISIEMNNYIVAIVRDITERKKIEEKIIKAKEEWEDTFDAIAEILFIHDKDNKIIRANSAYEQMAGIPFSEFIGKPYYEIFPRTESPDDLCTAAVTCGKPGEKEIVIDRTGKTYSLRMYPKLDGEGRYQYSVHVMRDITVRKQAEAALKASEEMFRQLTENINEVFWVCSPNLDMMIYVSPAYERVWGRTCQSRYETPMSFVEAIHPDDRENALAIIAESLGSANFSLDYRIIRPDGSIRWIHDRGFQVKNSSGQVYRLAGLAEDITELKTVQSRILQQEKMASLGQLAAGVAHEINNPIGFITSNMNTLNKYIDKILEFMSLQAKTLEECMGGSVDANNLKQIEERRRSLKIDYITQDISSLIVESLDGADRVKKIVQDLKSFARVDDTEYKLADINAGIESAINIVWSELKYKVTLNKEFGDIPPTMCNIGQLSQVFMNILVNAAHSIPTQGMITVKTWSADGNIYVSITDTGTGIATDALDKIFDPFFTTKEVGKGTGLGLSIAYEIVKKHDGEIKVDSEVGKGTTFTISILIVEG